MKELEKLTPEERAAEINERCAYLKSAKDIFGFTEQMTPKQYALLFMTDIFLDSQGIAAQDVISGELEIDKLESLVMFTDKVFDTLRYYDVEIRGGF